HRRIFTHGALGGGLEDIEVNDGKNKRKDLVDQFQRDGAGHHRNEQTHGFRLLFGIARFLVVSRRLRCCLVMFRQVALGVFILRLLYWASARRCPARWAGTGRGGGVVLLSSRWHGNHFGEASLRRLRNGKKRALKHASPACELFM